MIKPCRLGGFLFVSNNRPIPTGGADERPPNLVQLVADYFDAGSLNKALGALSTLSRD